MSEEQDTCKNCKFMRRVGSNMECRRNAPSTMTFWHYHMLEDIRAILWVLSKGGEEFVNDDQEWHWKNGYEDVIFPRVDTEGWCGEFKAK